MIDIEDIRKNYQNFLDEKIIDLARNSSKGLRKEVIPILKEEIIRRNLDISLLNWIEAESAELTKSEFESIKKNIICLKCPNCLNQNGYLFGFKSNKIISYVIDYDKITYYRIFCKKCGNKLILKSLLTTFGLGWWSIRGLFMTPITLATDIINLLFCRRLSEQIIDAFIRDNIGRIRTREVTDKSLTSLIKNFNKRQEQ